METKQTKLSQYIEENYVGQSSWGAYNFESSVPLREKAISLIRQEDEQRKQTTIEALANDKDFDTIFSVFNFEAQSSCDSEPERDFQAAFDFLNQCERQDKSRISNRLDLFVATKRKNATFTSQMLEVMRRKGISDTEAYNNVFMDRKLFNKIRNDLDYHPSRNTALLIAISLKLTYEETQALLWTAGYTLTHCNKRDLIIEFCIREGIYDVLEINEVLEQHKQRLLMKCK